MPFVIYIFTISSFALGLAEFVPIGLVDVMSQGLNVPAADIGMIVSSYALGATVSSPILTALSNSFSRKSVMLATAVIFFARQSDDRFIQRIGTDEPRPIRCRIGTRLVPRRRIQHCRPFGGQGKSGNRRGDCVQRLHPCHGVRRTAQHLFWRRDGLALGLDGDCLLRLPRLCRFAVRHERSAQNRTARSSAFQH